MYTLASVFQQQVLKDKGQWKIKIPGNFPHRAVFIIYPHIEVISKQSLPNRNLVPQQSLYLRHCRFSDFFSSMVYSNSKLPLRNRVGYYAYFSCPQDASGSDHSSQSHPQAKIKDPQLDIIEQKTGILLSLSPTAYGDLFSQLAAAIQNLAIYSDYIVHPCIIHT